MSEYQIKNAGRDAPTMSIDGKNVPPVLYSLSDFPAARSNTAQAQRNIKNFADAGIRLVCCDTGLHLGWRKVSPFDTEAMRAEIASVLDANPGAKVFLRLHMNPPYWWLRDHPEECLVYRTPEGDRAGIDDGESDRLIRGDELQQMRVSMASLRWLEEATEKLKLFLESLLGTREGEALMGLQVACGIYGEWSHWGVDVSKPMKEWFVRYLRETYQDVKALRKAWNREDITFETAEFRPEAFRSGDDGELRDPVKSRDTIDSQHCHQLPVPHAIRTFCRTAKEVMPNLLCGAFYGYYLASCGKEFAVRGDMRPDLLFADPNIDFLCGPACYGKNRNSTGVPVQRALLESQRLNGMLWLTEMDQHPEGTEKLQGGVPERFDESVAVLRRNALQTLLAGQGFWYYDHRIIPSLIAPDSQNASAGSIYRKNGWWDTPELMSEIAKIQRLAENITARPYQPVADVLLVYDTESFCNGAYILDAEYPLHEALMRNGAVFDCIYLRDLEKAEMERYRCVIFVNCVTLTKEQRKTVHALTANTTAVFLNGFGYCDGERLAEENISDAIGMTVRKIKADTVFVSGDKLMRESYYAPAFAVTEPDVAVFARWESGEAACAAKGNKIYFPFPYLPEKLTKTLLERANVHIWCDSDEPVLAGAGCVAINCQHGGERMLNLPNGKKIRVVTDGFATPVYDLASGTKIL